MNKYFPDYLLNHDVVAATRLIAEGLRSGYSVSIYDGEELTVKRSRESGDIYAAMGSTEADTVIMRDAGGVLVGRFLLIWGNSPGETIADYTVNNESERLAAYADEPWA